MFYSRAMDLKWNRHRTPHDKRLRVHIRRLGRLISLTSFIAQFFLLAQVQSAPLKPLNCEPLLQSADERPAPKGSLRRYIQDSRMRRQGPEFGRVPQFRDLTEEFEISKGWKGEDLPPLMASLLPSFLKIHDHSLRAAEEGAVKSATPGSAIFLRALLEKYPTNIVGPVNWLLNNGGVAPELRTLFGPRDWPQHPNLKMPKAVMFWAHGGGTKGTGSFTAVNLINSLQTSDIAVIGYDAFFHAEGPRILSTDPYLEFDMVWELALRLVPPGIPVFFAGHSKGGRDADLLWRLDRYDYSGYVLLAPVAVAKPGGSYGDRLDAEEAFEALRESLRHRMDPGDSELIESMIRDDKVSPLSGYQMSAVEKIHDWSRVGSKPALVVVGENDGLTYVGYEELFHDNLAHLPNVRFIVLPGEKDSTGSYKKTMGHVGILEARDSQDNLVVTHEIKSLIQAVLERQKGEGVLLQRNTKDEDPRHILSLMTQTYANNLAFREFVLDHHEIRVLPRESFARRLKIGGVLKKYLQDVDAAIQSSEEALNAEKDLSPEEYEKILLDHETLKPSGSPDFKDAKAIPKNERSPELNEYVTSVGRALRRAKDVLNGKAVPLEVENRIISKYEPLRPKRFKDHREASSVPKAERVGQKDLLAYLENIRKDLDAEVQKLSVSRRLLSPEEKKRVIEHLSERLPEGFSSHEEVSRFFTSQQAFQSLSFVPEGSGAPVAEKNIQRRSLLSQELSELASRKKQVQDQVIQLFRKRSEVRAQLASMRTRPTELFERRRTELGSLDEKLETFWDDFGLGLTSVRTQGAWVSKVLEDRRQLIEWLDRARDFEAAVMESEEILEAQLTAHLRVESGIQKYVLGLIEKESFTDEALHNLPGELKSDLRAYSSLSELYQSRLPLLQQLEVRAALSGVLGAKAEALQASLTGNAPELPTPESLEGQIQSLVSEVTRLEGEIFRKSKEKDRLTRDYVTQFLPEFYEIQDIRLSELLEKPFEQFGSSDLRTLTEAWKLWQQCWRTRPPESKMCYY